MTPANKLRIHDIYVMTWSTPNNSKTN